MFFFQCQLFSVLICLFNMISITPQNVKQSEAFCIGPTSWQRTAMESWEVTFPR